MQRFEFPLESVLRLRRFREAEARQALQEALGERNRAEELLAATRRAIAEATTRLSHGQTTMRPAEVVNAWRDLGDLETLALKQAAHLAECESQVTERREVYIAAQQERKPLERLKEEMRRSHLHDAEAAEQMMSDELAVIGHSRKGREP